MRAKVKLPSPAELVVSARDLVRENQTEFGARFGKSQSLISKYERGDIEPPGDMIIQLMTILGGSISLDKLAPARLAREIERLDEEPGTLPLRRAIRDLLELGRSPSRSTSA